MNLTLLTGMSPQLRLALPVPMSHPIKLMDENLQWCESGLEVSSFSGFDNSRLISGSD